MSGAQTNPSILGKRRIDEDDDDQYPATPDKRSRSLSYKTPETRFRPKPDVPLPTDLKHLKPKSILGKRPAADESTPTPKRSRAVEFGSTSTFGDDRAHHETTKSPFVSSPFGSQNFGAATPRSEASSLGASPAGISSFGNGSPFAKPKGDGVFGKPLFGKGKKIRDMSRDEFAEALLQASETADRLDKTSQDVTPGTMMAKLVVFGIKLVTAQGWKPSSVIEGATALHFGTSKEEVFAQFKEEGGFDQSDGEASEDESARDSD